MRVCINLVNQESIYLRVSSEEEFNKLTADIENGKTLEVMPSINWSKRNVFAHAIVSIEFQR